MADQIIEEGQVVSIEFSMHDNVDEIEESSELDGAPLVYLQGGVEMPVGFQKAMEGHRAGESFSFTLEPAQGWGEQHEEAMIEVSAEELGVEVEVGDIIEAEDDDGEVLELEVCEVRDDGSVLLDGNHPLAGKTVSWDVKVLEIRKATPEEIEQGEAGIDRVVDEED